MSLASFSSPVYVWGWGRSLPEWSTFRSLLWKGVTYGGKSFITLAPGFETKLANILKPWTGNPYWTGGLCTVDLLVLTSLDRHIFVQKVLFTFVTKWATPMRRSIVHSLPLQLVFPALKLSKPQSYKGLTKLHVSNALAYSPKITTKF